MIPLAQEESVPLTDNRFLDQWEIPFGEWMDQAVDWIDNNLQTLLSIIEWPFETLIGWLVQDFLVTTSWVWIVLGMGIIAALVRNLKVGAFVIIALITCGLLGNDYWIETARTIGFIFVAVVLCVAVGIPMGILAGRIDGVWQVTRPVLDAMQVVHSFVYMLPFIFFWGIGEVSATMVTMIFAVPPLIRLTNLGIRQVPGDVVEAARAHGAPEWRVLFDVQIPLARPAIMTGITQTLLLAISMLGIAAIMGAGGLGRLLFRALSNQDVALAASAGLAFFLVAVVLDRMSQREDTDTGNLWHRIRAAWAHRRDPEALLPDSGPIAVYKPVDRYEPLRPAERASIGLMAVGAVAAVVSVFLPWSLNGGKITSWGVRVDENMPGESFNGLAESGGSWFGYIVLGAALFVLLALVATLLRPGRTARWLTVDGALIAAMTIFATALAFAIAGIPPLAGDIQNGIGVHVGWIGGAVATLAGLQWIRIAPHSALHPLSADIQWGRLVGMGIAMFVIVIGAFGAWNFDGRQDVVVTPEIQQRIDELRQQAAENPQDAGAISAERSALMAGAQASGAITISGADTEGSRLGIISMLLGAIALATSLPAIGVLGREEHRHWVWSAITAGLGAGIAAIAFAWIFTFIRHADPNFISGVGSFLSLMGGTFVIGSTMGVLKEFRRSKVYDDEPAAAADGAASEAEEVAEELV